MIKTKIPAPDFTLSNQDQKPIKLSDYMGKSNVVLLFYPFDFSPVCSDETALFSQAKPIFDKKETTLLGISVDSPYCHKAFVTERNLKIDLLSDFEPKGAICKLYDVYEDKMGCSQRALFLIGKDGEIKWNYLSPIGENPGADGVLEAIDTLI